MDARSELFSLLVSSSSRFFCTHDEYIAALLSVLPAGISKQSFVFEILTYKQSVAKEFPSVKVLSEQKGVAITTDFSSPDVEQGSIAYHRIKGIILAESYWRFSSKQFEQDFLAAEANDAINVHFLHITSGGGEAWYLDRLSETLGSAQKPIYVLIEKTACSAAYYIGVHGNIIKALTQNDFVGSIGTMVSYLSIKDYLEKLGIREIEEYAERSDLKNKKERDLEDGKPKQFIVEHLNPLQQQFEAAVRAARSQLNTLPDNDPVFRGETFTAQPAIEKKLIDGLITFDEALSEANEMGKKWAQKNRNHNSLMSYI